MIKGPFSCLINVTRRYDPLGGPTFSSFGGLRPLAEAFFALQTKKRAYYAVLAHFFGNFWCPVVTLVTLNSNLSKFKRNAKKHKLIQKKSKKSKNKIEIKKNYK